MDCEWILSFRRWIRRIHLFLHRRWRAVKWTTFRTVGLGDNALHRHVNHCPRQSGPYHKVLVSPPQEILILVSGRNGPSLLSQGRLSFT